VYFMQMGQAARIGNTSVVTIDLARV